MEDTLRPGKAEIQGMLAKSLYTWKSYQTDGNGELPSDSVNPSAMLGHVPAFLGNHLSEHPQQHNLETTDDLWITGNATWRTTTGDCDLPEKVLSQRLLLGISSRASCSFTEDNRFRDWPGIENVEKPAKGNYIAILTLAWCYIFSAKWVEMQSQRNPDNSISINSEQLAYLNSLAYWTTQAADNSAADIDIDLGEIGNDAARWWTAILAPSHGWQACIFRFGRTYFSPWSIRLMAQERFILRRTPDIQDPDTGPPVMAERTAPSSDLALQYLSDFCHLHQIYGQCFAALAATLLIPYRAGDEQLLLPKPNIWPRPHTLPISPPSCKLHNQANLLPFYMTLSCNIRGVRPLLHGCLFEPSVTCNLVSPWFRGAFNTIDVLIQNKEYSKLAVVMARRQPKVAAIWLGAIILGMENHILRPIRAGMFAVDMLTAAWTCTAHSFLGPRQLIPSKRHETKISRSDESRLLYLVEAEGHTRVPICPWEPFGETDLSETDVEVREHTNCGGYHCLQYEGWTWDLRDGGRSDLDRGFHANEDFTDTNEEKGLVGPLQYRYDQCEVSEDLSANATRSIFGWLRSEGYPLGEREIWNHSWLKIDEEEEEEEEEEGEDDNDQIKSFSSESKDASSVEKWILESQSIPVVKMADIINEHGHDLLHQQS